MDLWPLFPSPGASTHGPTLPSTLQPLLILLVFGIIYQNNLLLTTSKIQLRWLNVDIMLDAVGFLLWATVDFVGFVHFFRDFWCAENTKSKFSLLLQPIIHAIHLTSLLTNPSAL